jgi:3-methyladenine DNA glycosylase/8-oxoguanine DNA glycosylase
MHNKLLVMRCVNDLKSIEDAVRADTLDRSGQADVNQFAALVQARVGQAVQIYAAQVIAAALDDLRPA